MEVPESQEVASKIQYYNIPSGLNGLGKEIHMHIIHTITNPMDVIQLLLTTRTIQQIRSDDFMKWALSPVVEHVYSLQTVPTDKVFIVSPRFCL